MRYLLLFIMTIGFIACSDSSTGTDESDVTSGEGAISVSGDIQAVHEGISQYIGAQNADGEWFNLALHVNELGLASEQESSFGFTIMVGSEGPFSLETGDYQIGENNNVVMIATYSNRVDSENTITYGSTPSSSGTITIVSITSTSIEVVFDVNLHLVEDEGSVNVAGAFNAECLTAEAGIGC